METILLTIFGLILAFLGYVCVVWAVSPADPPAKWDLPIDDKRNFV